MGSIPYLMCAVWLDRDAAFQIVREWEMSRRWGLRPRAGTSRPEVTVGPESSGQEDGLPPCWLTDIQ